MKTLKENSRLADEKKIIQASCFPKNNFPGTVIFLTFPRIIVNRSYFRLMNTAPDRSAFLKLMNDNQRVIFKICNLYCNSRTDREDLAQEIVYQLWKSGNSFNAEYKFSTWMYRIALNVAISFYRKRLTRPVIAVNVSHIDIEDPAEDREELEEDITNLQKFIAGLKELDRAIMLLYLEEKTYKEIAEIIGISETNTATKISRIKDILKQKFSSVKK
jgi:RNA polymerase sigma-70 factor (ECF subfamily)